MDGNEALIEAIRALPDGFYAHPLSSFINGNVSTTKRGTVKIPIELGIEQLGSPYTDLRAVLNPEGNKLIPLMLFVDPEIAAKAIKERP